MGQHNTSINDSTESDYELLILSEDDLLFREWMELMRKQKYAESEFFLVLSVIEISIMILTLIALCFIIKSRPASSVFVSNLILSDLIQVICILKRAAISWSSDYMYGAYFYSLIASLYFMACVAFERYLLVSYPIWYRSHHSLKLSCFISVIVWFVPLIFAEIDPPIICFKLLPLCIACLIPYPIIILCFAGTCRGLSHAISLTALKRKLILGTLFLVLLTYTLIILPFVIMSFITLITKFYFYSFKKYYYFYCYAQFVVYVNPLADCVLYMLIRPDVGNLIKSVCCYCRHQRWNHNQDEHSVVNPQSSCCTVVCCISAEKPASHSLNTCSSV